MKEYDDVALFQPSIDILRPRLRQHSRRQVDTGEVVAKRLEGRAAQAGAAAKIERGGECYRRPARLHGAQQQFRRAVAQPLRQRLIEFRRIAVEQSADIAFRHRGDRGGGEADEVQFRAVTVLRIGVGRFPERRHRAVAIVQSLAHLAEREPGCGIARRQFQRLRQQVGGGREIALAGKVARPLEAAVGDNIAG